MLSKFFFKEIGKHNDIPDEEFDSKQLNMGIEVEKEHTDNEEEAKSIAKDHLVEPGLSKSYYTKLNAMEKRAKKNLNKKKGI